MNKKYIGITIGPILDTMLDASSPAAMWFSSFLFSDITRRICEKLVSENKFGKVEIYSPYYSEEVNIYQDGVGKFHDRILFSIEPESMDYEERLKAIIDSVKSETVQYFQGIPDFDQNQAKQFLVQYFQIYYVIQDELENNIILDMSDQLSAMELMKTFPKDNSVNPIVSLLLGYEDGKNQLIKKSTLYQNVQNKEALEQNGTIRTIEMIAASAATGNLKSEKYFAVVNADGDRMGGMLSKLNNDQLNQFSKKLFDHASNAAMAIKKYGGMTIYAGGDDLLFLAPVIGNDGNTILNLCDKIRSEFADLMKDGGEASPTLSFGVAVQYYKAPLYEALEKSRNLLADSKNQEGKNRTTLHLQKHSGQSVYLSIPNDHLVEIEEFLKIGMQGTDSDETNTLHSQIYVLEQFKPLYQELIQRAFEENMQRDKFVELWCHLFDNISQTVYLDYVKQIAGFFYDKFVVSEDKKLAAVSEVKGITVLSTLLRLKKFLKEKGNEG